MTLILHQYPPEGAEIFVGEAMAMNPSFLIDKMNITVPPGSGTDYIVNISCNICFYPQMTPVVFVHYSDSAAGELTVNPNTSPSVSAAQANTVAGVVYATATVDGLVTGESYTLMMTCHEPQPYVWSKDFVATGTSQSFDEAAAPLTCSSSRYIVVRSADGLLGGYREATINSG